MKINSLELTDFRNLKAFNIDFSEDYKTIILGQNGLGKSNLFEAIIRIFRSLELNIHDAELGDYKINYTCSRHDIFISAQPKSGPNRTIKVNGEQITYTKFKDGFDLLMPKHIFFYYSGWDTAIEALFNKPTYNYYNSVLNNHDMPMRRFFYCRKDYAHYSILALLFSKYTQFSNDLLNLLNIQSIESTLIVMKEPYWVKKRGEGDVRFWRAKGAFQSFLRKLWDNALAPIRHKETREIGFNGKKETKEKLYIYIKDSQTLEKLGIDESSKEMLPAKEVFKLFESLFLCDLIDEVNVRLKKKDTNEIINFSQLSEGEKQFLIVLSLMLFTKDDESLFLLDEPDTHLNAKWSYEYLEHIEKVLADETTTERFSSQLILTSHDPVIIAGVKADNVRLLEKDESAIVAIKPAFDPRGLGVEGVIQEFSDLRSSFPKNVLEDIDLKYRLLSMRELTEQLKQDLESVEQRLSEYGILNTYPNPYFNEFSRAMSRNPLFSKPTLTDEEKKKQNEIADKILNKIISGETSCDS